MAINAIGNGIPFPRGIGIPYSIKNSMVLWYDPKRQGATNESMSTNPVLRDLSGNGHDATCYNFAWSGESGIGSYKQHKFIGSTYRRVITNAGGWDQVSASYDPSISWKIRVTCPTKPILKEYGTRLFCPNWVDTSWLATLSEPLEDGKVTTISPYTGDEDVSVLWIDLNSLKGHEVIIEQVPEYPHALVADGVDDYAAATNTPLLTDYTIIYKRRKLTTASGDNCLFSKRNAPTTDNEGAFQIERGRSLYSFGRHHSSFITDDDIEQEICYQTKSLFNGRSINYGNAVDTQYFTIFKFNKDSISNAYAGALYSVILFNRTLTTEEIEWVKENLIKGDTEL